MKIKQNLLFFLISSANKSTLYEYLKIRTFQYPGYKTGFKSQSGFFDHFSLSYNSMASLGSVILLENATGVERTKRARL